MKKFAAQFSLVLVLLLGVTSCTNYDFEEIPVFEAEDMELFDMQSQYMGDDSDPDDEDKTKSKND